MTVDECVRIAGIAFLFGACFGAFVLALLGFLELRRSSLSCECKDHPAKLVLHVGELK